MSLLKKIFTAIRGGATEVGQAIVDSQSLRILDQEIRDATNALNKSRDDLTRIMAQRKLAADKLAPKEAKLREYEGYAAQALEKNDEALALEIAAKIAELEGEIAEQRALIEDYDKSIVTLKKAIQDGEKTVARLKVQVDQVKATATVQRAQATIAARHSGTNATISTALESLERIKAKQAETAARMEAARELAQEEEDGDLHSKLKKAGIIQEQNSASAVLERLRKQRAEGGK
jgi:Phage shock protein A (IM30), suppresses sigma54-dependent transcription